LGLVRGLVLVAAVLALTACSGSPHAHLSSAVVRHVRGLPPGVSAQHWPPASASAYRPSAAWAGPTSIYLMTWGSSSCPHLPTSVRADRPGQLLISTAGDLYSGGMCTADLSVTTSIVRLPAGIDSSRRLAVQINKTRVTLPARVECGAWAAQDSAQARAVLATRGRLTSCELIGRTWMVTTVSAHRPGEVGLLTCSAGD
jgi:hypothetical protein